MKRVFYIFLTALLFTACEKALKEEEPKLGGIYYGGVFSKTSEGFADAHKRVWIYPSSTETAEIEFHCSGLDEDCIHILEQADGITLELGQGFPWKETDHYWNSTLGGYVYAQSLIIKFQPNLTQTRRLLKAEIHTNVSSAAEITIIQQGRQ